MTHPSYLVSAVLPACGLALHRLLASGSPLPRNLEEGSAVEKLYQMRQGDGDVLGVMVPFVARAVYAGVVVVALRVGAVAGDLVGHGAELVCCSKIS